MELVELKSVNAAFFAVYCHFHLFPNFISNGNHCLARVCNRASEIFRPVLCIRLGTVSVQVVCITIISCGSHRLATVARLKARCEHAVVMPSFDAANTVVEVSNIFS